MILRLPVLLGMVQPHVGHHPLIDWMNLQEWSSFWHWLISSLLIFLQATTINRMIIKNRLSRDPSLMGGLGYIVLSAIFKDMTYISGDLIALSFFIPTVSYLFDIYKKFRVELDMFNAGILTGIAALLEPSFLLFMALGIIALVKLRTFRLRELLQYLNAVILPFLMVWGLYYLFGETADFYKIFGQSGWDFSRFREFFSMQFFRWGILLLSLITALSAFNAIMIKKSIQAQKKIEVLYWIMLISLPVTLFGPTLSDQDFLIFFFPVGIFLGMILHRTPNRPLAEVIHYALFFGSLSNQYYGWW